MEIPRVSSMTMVVVKVYDLSFAKEDMFLYGISSLRWLPLA
jgi:hypothetical protein